MYVHAFALSRFRDICVYDHVMPRYASDAYKRTAINLVCCLVYFVIYQSQRRVNWGHMPSKHIVFFYVNLLLLQTLLFRLDLSYDAQQGYAAVVVYRVITLAFRISWTTAPFSNIGKYVHTSLPCLFISGGMASFPGDFPMLSESILCALPVCVQFLALPELVNCLCSTHLSICLLHSVMVSIVCLKAYWSTT